MDIPNRRAFLSTAAAAIATQARPILGANDRVNLAVVGLGGRGANHMDEWVKQPNSRVAALCDINQEAQERGQARVEKTQGQKPRIYGDMRQLFADKDVDVVSFATPNHWHALGAIWACQAGKDVYAEKPACHNIWEGGKMVEAARKYKRIVQVGSQGRSLKHKIHAMRLLREGVVGKLYLAKGMCYKRRRSIGHTPDQPAPPGVNWDMFLGPAPVRPFSATRRGSTPATRRKSGTRNSSSYSPNEWRWIGGCSRNDSPWSEKNSTSVAGSRPVRASAASTAPTRAARGQTKGLDRAGGVHSSILLESNPNQRAWSASTA